MVKIIAGSCRGRSLVTGKDDRLRPTTGRVKEALFSILGGRVVDARVLDLFAGTGNLGLEALSRGAASAIFVDNNRQSLNMIRENVTSCGFTSQATIFPGSALKEKLYIELAEVVRQRDGNGKIDLVFLDPPYGRDMAQNALNHLTHSPILAEKAAIVTEEAENVTVFLPCQWSILQSRAYGDTRITIWSR